MLVSVLWVGRITIQTAAPLGKGGSNPLKVRIRFSRMHPMSTPLLGGRTENAGMLPWHRVCCGFFGRLRGFPSVRSSSSYRLVTDFALLSAFKGGDSPSLVDYGFCLKMLS